MLRFTKNTNGIMGLTLSQIGLFLATGILLTVVISTVFLSNWQRTEEMHALASSLSSLAQDLDASFFENTNRFEFPEKNYAYAVQLSPEYIVIHAKGYGDSDIFVNERFLIQPWIRLSDQNWTSGGDLHAYLNMTCGHCGTQDDPISPFNFTQLTQEQNMTKQCFALHPLEMSMNKPVFLEKVSIFYGIAEKHDFLLVYQLC